MTFLSFLMPRWAKKDKQDQEPKPFMSFMHKGKDMKRRKMSDSDIMDLQEDRQRSNMIRKSLASRTSTRTTMDEEDDSTRAWQEEQNSNNNDINGDDSEEDSNGPNCDNLRSDWKAYEANLQRNRSVLIRTHPGIDRSAGSSSRAPSCPSSFTSTTPSTTTTTSRLYTASSQATPPQRQRQHTFSNIARKPLPPLPTDNNTLAASCIERATTHG
ncbi:hypothetical protein BGZ63DRAFT_420526 [Mariannaea sp. PMI_226]|nr:hypothetical protein BGZ63DRAFT_420526 [Mariannaea sp. PMI_226]